MALKRIAGIVLLYAVCALRCEAQFLGYVGQQTTQQSLATNLPCTGIQQILPINNIGQAQHYLSITSVTNAQQFQAQLIGFDNQGNSYVISDALMAFGATGLTVRGSGYYPRVAAQVLCSPATTAFFTASYSGTQSGTDVNAGSYLSAQIDKMIYSGLAQNANQSANFQTPYGSSAGTLSFQYGGASAGGGTLTVQCQNVQFFYTIFVGTLQNLTALQTFQIPDVACPSVTVTYGNDGQAGTVVAEYVFNPPGRIPTPAYHYTHVTGTSATAAKATVGFLHTLSVNTGAAGTISIFDLPTAGCTGTPSTNTVAVITATTTTLQTFTYDVNLVNGICVKASVAMDFTVATQ